MDFQESFERLKNILLGDIGNLERVAISILFGLVILVFFHYISKWIKRLAVSRISKKTNDLLLADFVGNAFRILIFLFGITLLFRFLGLSGAVSGILASAGITAFIIGFALKDIGENFLAGLLLAFKRPFRIGDLIDIQGVRGRVISLNLRDTQIKTSDGKDVYLPNASIIKNPLVNFTIDGFLSYQFVVGLDYGSDYQKALNLIESTLKTVEGVLQERKPTVNISDLSPSTLNITVVFWVNTYDPVISDMKIKSNAILAVLTALEKEGYNLPGDIIEIKRHRTKN
ncbi:mechanosensitive ion channel family protein [Aquiflexum sp. TKW24L]|uniref:mechanosensitive ion channel family protein n=1 Tax=Aquiflexum sp. TKW24L TaxID=2942212 RepID=UPI0020BFDCA8|nr:mechanosensitive ion channel family protein [Aquiflexum sp. TKW24L]MCL6261579.1 mechanosensitive ion channel family protein [Aquiflexum sp. TKW24L]